MPAACGYQDVEGWVRELRAAGWRPWSLWRGEESPGSTTWKAPSGAYYRGPYGAWTVMKAQQPDPVCVHGTALDVHCCGCHSGFIFDLHHECPDDAGGPR